MARPATNHETKKAQIAEIALHVFAKYGFAGTSYRLIAKEAKEMGLESISPPLLYHYFPEGKEELFIASIRQLPPFQKFEQILYDNQNEPPDVFLPILARTYFEFLKTPELLPTLRLILTDGTNYEGLLEAALGELIPRILQPMIGYFEKQVQLGNIRPMKYDQLIMQMFGPLLMRRVALNVLPVEKLPLQFSDDAEYLESLLETLMHGILR